MESLLEVRNLSKGYRFGQTSITVLQGISVNVSPAEMVVIMGPSGSGKTTLLNCIAGIDNPDSGEVLVAGKSIDYHSETEKTLIRRKSIGMVFQFFNLIPTLTVWDNVALPFLISKIPEDSFQARVRDMIAKVGLESRADHYPSHLSGGEMQLVSIARALVHSPALLLADEPTGNVNHKVGRAIMDILRRTAKEQGTGIAMVTHSPEHAAWADRVCFLKDGVIVKEHLQRGNKDAVSAIYEHLVELGI
jgi:putative ABC transport system ATP-binding protein